MSFNKPRFHACLVVSWGVFFSFSPPAASPLGRDPDRSTGMAKSFNFADEAPDGPKKAPFKAVPSMRGSGFMAVAAGGDGAADG